MTLENWVRQDTGQGRVHLGTGSLAPKRERGQTGLHCYKQAPSRYYLRCLKATFNPKQNKIYVGSNFNAHDVGDKIANYMNSIT